MATLLFVSQSCTKNYTVSVYGVVTDSETKKPLEGALVTCENKFMETGADGYYELNDITAIPLPFEGKKVELLVVASSYGYHEKGVTLTISSDVKKEVNFELKKW